MLSDFYESGRRGSNPRPSAWKANALSTELLPHLIVFYVVGKDGFEPPKAKASRFTVCPIWPLWYLPILYFRAEDGAQTRDPQLGRLMLYRLSYFRI